MKIPNYKLDKYISKYNSTKYIDKKYIYAQKFIYYLDTYLKNQKVNKTSQYGGTLSENLLNYKDALVVIEEDLKKINPVYQLIRQHDKLFDSVLSTPNADEYVLGRFRRPGLAHTIFTEYKNDVEIIDYYDKIYEDIVDNFDVSQ